MAKRKPENEFHDVCTPPALKVPRKELLFEAVLRGNVEDLQALLNNGAVDVNVTNWSGETALFVASDKENLEVLQALLSSGANVNVTNKDGQTALFVAASQGSVEVVEALLSHKVDVNVTDWRGQTALFTAVEEGHLNVVQVLLSHVAVKANVADEDGQTALFLAVSNVNVEVVEALVSHDGIDVNVTDSQGETALFPAALKGNVEVVEVLLRHGIDVNITNCLGQTALFTAASKGNVEVVQSLLHHGIGDVNLQDQKGQTALLSAIKSGSLAVIDILLMQGANPSIQDQEGNSVLFQMAQLFIDGFSSDLIIQILKKATVNALNASGETLLLHYLSYARTNKMERDSLHNLVAVCRFLVEEVDVKVRSRSGHSVIHLILMLLQVFLAEGRPQTWKVQTTSIFEAVENLSKLFQSILSTPTFAKTMVSSRDDIDGNTPLHLWASLTYPPQQSTVGGGASTSDTESTLESIISDVGSQLLSHGAQVSAPNTNGETPLHVAQKWSAAKILLDQNALQTATDNFGNTPLLTHVKQNIGNHTFHDVYDDMKAETVCQQWREVFGFNIDPWEANDEGKTILSLILAGGSFDVVQAFLEATGAPYGRKYPVDSNGDTPLHVICRDSGENNFWKLNLIDLLVRSAPHMVNRLNSRRETAVHIACKRQSADPLSLEIIQRLRAYGAQIDLRDDKGKTCFDVAAGEPELVALLKQDIKLSEIDPWLPWSRKSERHKDLLDQVARGQNKLHTDSFHYHTEPIGSGAFGHVYAGLDSKDGREVAVKRIERVQMCRAEDRREIQNLVQLADCKHVVRYLSYCGDQDFLYIVLELMEGTLEELPDTDIRKEEVSLCRDVLSGLNFLHENNIIHRDIKPGNILYKCSPLCLKLADFGLSGKAEKAESAPTTTVMHSKAGTRCWMAPEVLSEGTMQHSKESDVFTCGLVLHYLLSRKKHPFEPKVKPDESIFVIQHGTEDNILKNGLVIDTDLSAESKDLVKLMVSWDKARRPSAAEALRHPFFWSNHKKVHLLCVIGNQAELASAHHPFMISSLVEQEIEKALCPQFAINPWDGEFPQLYAEMTLSRKSRSYATDSAVDLVRFVRNTHGHHSYLTADMQTSVLEDCVFLDKFPTLLMAVFNAVTTHKWDLRQDIASAINATQ